jgi:hypothetical protein
MRLVIPATRCPFLSIGRGRGVWGCATSNFIGIYGEDGSINDGSWHHWCTLLIVPSLPHLPRRIPVRSRALWLALAISTPEKKPLSVRTLPALIPEAAEADIDDVGVWRRVLTLFEVYSIYAVAQAARVSTSMGPSRSRSQAMLAISRWFGRQGVARR